MDQVRHASVLHCTCYRGWTRAFTLIELMIVIGIVAIIMAAGIPPFAKALRKEGLRKAVSDVVEGCSHARAQAVLKGTPAELLIRAEDGQIAVRPLQTRRTSDGSGTGAFTEELGSAQAGPTVFRANLPDDVAVRLLDVNFKDHMEYPEARVRFFPNGTCDEFTIVLTSSKGEQQVSLDIITGLAEVKVLR